MVTNSAGNLATGTSGQIVVGQGSGSTPLFKTPTAGTGLTGTFNTTTHDYALTIPVAKTSGGSGSTNFTGNRTLLGTQSPTGTTAVFNSWTTGYQYYLCEFIEVIPTTTSTRLEIAFSTDGGSTYTNVTWDNGGFDAASTGGGSFVANSGVSATPDILLGNVQTNNADEGVNGWLYLWGLDSSGTFRKVMHQYITHPTGTNSMTFRNIGYHVRLTTQVTGLRFIYSGAGGFASGTINFYGVN